MPHYVNVALGCFFLAQVGTVVVVGVPYGFLLLRVGKALSHRRNEDGFVPYVRLGCKKCDRKKQQKGWLCGSLKKDRASPERFILSEGRGFF
jgi:hypothetical protein